MTFRRGFWYYEIRNLRAGPCSGCGYMADLDMGQRRDRLMLFVSLTLAMVEKNVTCDVQPRRVHKLLRSWKKHVFWRSSLRSTKSCTGNWPKLHELHVARGLGIETTMQQVFTEAEPKNPRKLQSTLKPVNLTVGHCWNHLTVKNKSAFSVQIQSLVVWVDRPGVRQKPLDHKLKGF